MYALWRLNVPQVHQTIVYTEKEKKDRNICIKETRKAGLLDQIVDTGKMVKGKRKQWQGRDHLACAAHVLSHITVEDMSSGFA